MKSIFKQMFVWSLLLVLIAGLGVAKSIDVSHTDTTQGIYVTDSGNGIGIEVVNTNESSGAYSGVFRNNAISVNDNFVAMTRGSSQQTLYAYRNLNSGNTSDVVALIKQDHENDDQHTLLVENDGEGYSIASTSTGIGTAGYFTNSRYGTNYVQLADGSSKQQTIYAIRDLNSGNNSRPVVEFINDNAADDQPTLRVRNDGSGSSILVNGGNVEIDDIAAGVGTDYVCVDTGGVLSSGASCTEFEDTNTVEEYSLGNNEFIVLDMEDELYPEHHPTHAGEVHNYYATVVFDNNGQDIQGTIKVPGNMLFEDEILYYLKTKIEDYKEINLPRRSKTVGFTGVIHSTDNIDTKSIKERNNKHKTQNEEDKLEYELELEFE